MYSKEDVIIMSKEVNKAKVLANAAISRRKEFGVDSPFILKAPRGIIVIAKLDEYPSATWNEIKLKFWLTDQYGRSMGVSILTDFFINNDHISVPYNKILDEIIKTYVRDIPSVDKDGRLIPRDPTQQDLISQFYNLRMNDRIGLWQIVRRSGNDTEFKNLADPKYGVTIKLPPEGFAAKPIAYLFSYDSGFRKREQVKYLTTRKDASGVINDALQYMYDTPLVTGSAKVPRKHPRERKADYVAAYGRRHAAEIKKRADKQAIHDKAVKDAKEMTSGFIMGRSWDTIQSMQMGKGYPTIAPVSPPLPSLPTDPLPEERRKIASLLSTKSTVLWPEPIPREKRTAALFPPPFVYTYKKIRCIWDGKGQVTFEVDGTLQNTFYRDILYKDQTRPLTKEKLKEYCREQIERNPDWIALASKKASAKKPAPKKAPAARKPAAKPKPAPKPKVRKTPAKKPAAKPKPAPKKDSCKVGYRPITIPEYQVPAHIRCIPKKEK